MSGPPDLPEQGFTLARDFAATVSRLVDQAGEAQDGRAVRIFQRFEAALGRGFAALHPRRCDPGESPLTGGPLLDPRWDEEAFDLFERMCEAEGSLPDDADPRLRHQVLFLKGLAEVLWACFREGARAIRAEAYVTALASLDNADENDVRLHRAVADRAWAQARMSSSSQVLKVVQHEEPGDEDGWDASSWAAERRARRKLAVEYAARFVAATKAHRRANDRVNRSWARVRASWTSSRIATHGARSRGHARRRGCNRHQAGSRRTAPARGDPDDGDPEPPGLALWRHPRFGSCTPLRVLVAGS